jgi:hypothetical protein
MELDDIFIEASNESFRRLTQGSSNHAFYANREKEGILNFVFSGVFSIDPKELQSTKKIALALESSGERGRLKLSLSDPDVRSIFIQIISDLLNYSQVFADSSDQVMAEQLISRYQKWLEIFRRGKPERLSPSEVQGLVGELLFLDEIVSPQIGVHNAVVSWTGPSLDEQDFLLPAALIEIKSSIQSKDARIQISSENQLDIVSGKIFLVHQTLKVGQGISLNSIVEKIRAKKRHSAFSRDAFEGKLCEVGYEILGDYDEPLFACDGRKFFEVDEGFPKLARSKLSPAIQRVSYALEINQLSEFERDKSVFENEVLNVD